MSDQEMQAIRARAALGVLIENGSGLPRAQVWAAVSRQHPLSEAELEPVLSGTKRGEVDWNFTTAEFVKAGWLIKGGTDGWLITEAGPLGGRFSLSRRLHVW